MPTTSYEGESKAFRNLLFKNDKDEKHCLFSIEPTTWNEKTLHYLTKTIGMKRFYLT
jgi:hypothetical protein